MIRYLPCPRCGDDLEAAGAAVLCQGCGRFFRRFGRRPELSLACDVCGCRATSLVLTKEYACFCCAHAPSSNNGEWPLDATATAIGTPPLSPRSCDLMRQLGIAEIERREREARDRQSKNGEMPGDPSPITRCLVCGKLHAADCDPTDERTFESFLRGKSAAPIPPTVGDRIALGFLILSGDGDGEK